MLSAWYIAKYELSRCNLPIPFTAMSSIDVHPWIQADSTALELCCLRSTTPRIRISALFLDHHLGTYRTAPRAGDVENGPPFVDYRGIMASDLLDYFFRRLRCVSIGGCGDMGHLGGDSARYRAVLDCKTGIPQGTDDNDAIL